MRPARWRPSAHVPSAFTYRGIVAGVLGEIGLREVGARWRLLLAWIGGAGSVVLFFILVLRGAPLAASLTALAGLAGSVSLPHALRGTVFVGPHALRLRVRAERDGDRFRLEAGVPEEGIGATVREVPLARVHTAAWLRRSVHPGFPARLVDLAGDAWARAHGRDLVRDLAPDGRRAVRGFRLLAALAVAFEARGCEVRVSSGLLPVPPIAGAVIVGASAYWLSSLLAGALGLDGSTASALAGGVSSGVGGLATSSGSGLSIRGPTGRWAIQDRLRGDRYELRLFRLLRWGEVLVDASDDRPWTEIEADLGSAVDRLLAARRAGSQTQVRRLRT